MNFHREPITFVGQVNLKIQNLERSIAFYKEVIGFKVLEQTSRSAKFSADGKIALLSVEQPEHVVPKQGRTTGLYHFALLLPKRTDLANIVQHFAKIGLQFGSSDHLVSEALYLSDPDGNGIEIYVDRDPSEWNWKNKVVEMTVEPLNFPDLLSIGNEQSWKGLPIETTMGHIHLHVSELSKTEEFYIKGLGFEVVNQFGSQALFISDGKYHHHIGLNTWNGVGASAPPPNSVGLESFILMLSSEEKKNKIIAQLKGIGASVTEKSGSIITTDPSGNRIHLIAKE
ncbi:glyoxalase [Alkalihalobacillus alcalophilus ATCC 27647 = CGMCC 1.3604]|uniref:Glyoxalase n=1 Tax=Alkalihalobacillus alcalophilus ATCC 27647 = CGMCC 1.3604 TaxID=1218173 RepID=A0A094WI47_ALKAL|nr:VOC family protein [Alkalihalobacillus alcalophilus]KGA97464.1 glyoxalase [Alkalihalobacillus alcalophilus ATCC 27647 = CGMCC 1.3604]MED1562216.1 VOC family protein [Alkalihalobacillus alcalophilus]THG89988.1 glyoxalase [Alkalihalobacillus alcalophilus ATCC 27647 = CGMCC 1.3604]